MINLILLPLRLKQMGKVQELAGLPAWRREIHEVDSCCKVAYIQTDMQTHTYSSVENRENKETRKKVKNCFIQIILIFPE